MTVGRGPGKVSAPGSDRHHRRTCCSVMSVELLRTGTYRRLGLSLTLEIQNNAEVPGMVGEAKATALNAVLLGQEQDPIHIV